MGNITRRTLPSGRAVNYSFDGAARVSGVASSGQNYAQNILYHPNAVIASMAYGNGQSFTQTLNSRQLPLRIRSTLGSNTAIDLQYDYDSRQNVIDIIDWTNRSRDRDMTYDGLSRLKTADGVWGQGSFSYDPLGNLRRKELGSRVVTVAYNSLNRASSNTDTAGSTRSINYDSQGNVTQLGGLTFDYDSSNQPVLLSGSSNGVYVYDGNFRRVKSVVDGKTIYNVYDAFGSLVHVDEINGGDITVCLTSCSEIAVPTSTDYIRANGMTIARLENDVPTYLHPDLLGSPVSSTNTAGGINWEEHYTPFGEKWESSSANNDQMSFTGHIADSATGLTYMQARYYDPVIGRFLSNDPVILQEHMNGAQGLQGFNRYAYVNNNPYKYTDPNGEAACAGFCIGAAVANGVYRAHKAYKISKGLRAAAAANQVMNEASDSDGAATGQDAVDIVTGGEDSTHETERGGKTTEHFPPISGEAADDKMSEIKGLDGVSVDETENERGGVTVVTTGDGTKVIDRKGAGDVRTIETQSSGGKERTKTRVEER